MKLDAVLTKASRLARRGRYETAIRTLIPEVNRYHGSYRYYYLLGASCLYAGDFGSALTYFRLANKEKKRDPLAILGLAALYLRRNETERAVDLYLEVLEIDPKNKNAKKAMGIIRKYAGRDSFSAWLETGKLHILFPPFPFPGFSAKAVAVLILSFLALSAACFGLLAQFGIISFNKYTRPGIDKYLISSSKNGPIQSEGIFLNSDEADKIYKKALEYFNNYNDELAKVELNRILNSNASVELKNSAIILKNDLIKNIPGFNTLKDVILFSDVIADPVLYEGVYVIWEGMPANLILSDNATIFDLLIDYKQSENPSFMGPVKVVYDMAVTIDGEKSIKVLGRITLIDEKTVSLIGIEFPYQSIKK